MVQVLRMSLVISACARELVSFVMLKIERRETTAILEKSQLEENISCIRRGASENDRDQ